MSKQTERKYRYAAGSYPHREWQPIDHSVGGSKKNVTVPEFLTPYVVNWCPGLGRVASVANGVCGADIVHPLCASPKPRIASRAKSRNQSIEPCRKSGNIVPSCHLISHLVEPLRFAFPKAFPRKIVRQNAAGEHHAVVARPRQITHSTARKVSAETVSNQAGKRATLFELLTKLFSELLHRPTAIRIGSQGCEQKNRQNAQRDPTTAYGPSP